MRVRTHAYNSSVKIAGRVFLSKIMCLVNSHVYVNNAARTHARTTKCEKNRGSEQVCGLYAKEVLKMRLESVLAHLKEHAFVVGNYSVVLEDYCK